MYQSTRKSFHSTLLDAYNLLHAYKRSRSDRPSLIGWGKALAFAVGVTGGMAALDLPAEKPCDTYEPSCGAGLCDCGACDGGYTEVFDASCGCEKGRCDGIGSPKLRNPIVTSLDALAGGIEKALGLDRCKKTCACVNSCQCFRGPRASAAPHAPSLQPMTSPRHVKPSLPSVPPLPNGISPRTVQPRIFDPSTESVETQPRRVEPFEPRIIEPTPEPPTPVTPEMFDGDGGRNDIQDPSRAEAEPQTQPRESQPRDPQSQPRIVRPEPSENAEPNRLPDPAAEPAFPFDNSETPKNDPADAMEDLFGDPATPAELPKAETPDAEKSPFDILEDLEDPFEEDVINLRKPYRPIRPTSQRSSTRRQIKPIVGSGLRPVKGPAMLRPVNHEEPMSRGLAPLGGGGVLSPYRGSR